MYNVWPIANTMNAAAGYVANSACCASPLLSAMSAESAERTLGRETAGRILGDTAPFMGMTGALEALTGGSDRKPKAQSQRLDQRPGHTSPELPGQRRDAKPGGGDLVK